MKDQRKDQLLLTIIKEHIHTAAPVASKMLAEKDVEGKSSAMIRNELSELEAEGFITHPHTSAGRIPTEKGWRYYITHLMKEKAPSVKEREQLQKTVHSAESEHDALKNVARVLADMSRNAAIVGFSKDDVYYTGLSNVFAAPEFSDVLPIRRMSEVIDHLDQVMHELFSSVDTGVTVLLGKENPFGEGCGVVIQKFSTRRNAHILGILGPVRMAYDTHTGLLSASISLLNERNP